MANSEDPSPRYTLFAKTNMIFRERNKNLGWNYTCDPSIYIMYHLKFIVSYQMEEPISVLKEVIFSDGISMAVNGKLQRHNWQFMYDCTRVIRKICSMVIYLSNWFTNTILFGIILKSYLSSMLWRKFYEDVMMQTRKILLWIHVLNVYWKMQNFSGKYNFLPFEKCAEY